jgi:geranylgeranyl diphosphate synthase type I
MSTAPACLRHSRVTITPALREAVEADEEELRRVAGLIEDAGGRSWALAEAARRMALAEDALRGVELDAGARDELLALGRFVVDREV